MKALAGGMISEAIRRACVAAALRKPARPGMCSSALRLHEAEKNSEAAAALLTAATAALGQDEGHAGEDA